MATAPEVKHRPEPAARPRRERPFLARALPPALEPLTELALDLRWTWSHGADALWRTVQAGAGYADGNPWLALQDAPAERLEALAADHGFVAELRRLAAERRAELEAPAWFQRTHAGEGLHGVGYFSMEFGFGEGLPLYAGGLGVLAADHLKSASDLGVPVTAVGLLYQEGYFRQMVDASGAQREAYPYNDPLSLPIQPALDDGGGWRHLSLELPGRRLWLRVWQAVAGRAALYLLDANDPMNGPVDRAITGKLYGGGSELRLLQELVLGVGGWRLLEELGARVEVCHLNEGHAAFAAVERARRFALAHGVGFRESLWATRAGNVFTTHTPVAAGFDAFAPALLERYQPALELAAVDLPLSELLALGRRDPADAAEPFNMAHLALRTCARANGVSRLHGEVSRRLFEPLFPRWPAAEIPVGHVTNGVHVPTWDSAQADALWTRACGKDRWRRVLDRADAELAKVDDAGLWALRTSARHELVAHARERLARQLGQRGEPPATVAVAARALDPDTLTLGFARRFAEYKRPNLLLSDPGRLVRLLTRADRPVQLLVAGKAHPEDEPGKRLVQEWVRFAARPEVRRRVLFLEDYDHALAERLVAGVDVWINTPRRPWEACGTSGMKVLVNGGLNLSVLDGWWAEAYAPEVGWAVGDGGPSDDARDALELYRLLEDEVVPCFYARDAAGVPQAWLARMRESMCRLTPRFAAGRMVREYVEGLYLPAAADHRRRAADGARAARDLAAWEAALDAGWADVRVGRVDLEAADGGWRAAAQVFEGGLPPDAVRAEVYADPAAPGEAALRVPLSRAEPCPGTAGGHLWRGLVPGDRPSTDLTVRVVPHHPEARIPAEAHHVRWQR